MRKPELPCEGGCRCGAVRFRISAPPMLTMACHCKGCQRMTAGPNSLSAAIPADGFAVIQGETVIGGAGDPPMHHFCPRCMSWLFTRMPGLDHLVNVRASLLDDTDWFSPFIETFTAEKLPWAFTPALHSFPGAPSFDDYMRLSADYAEPVAFEIAGVVDTDAIEPVRIRHGCDELHEELGGQTYNFIDYEFVELGAWCSARFYLNAADQDLEVFLGEVFADPSEQTPVENPAFRAKVLAFLKRRFDEILDTGGELIWRRSARSAPAQGDA